MAGLSSLWALEGRWLLTRKITHSTNVQNHFTGEAHFDRSGPRLIQTETGQLSVADQSLEAKQRYFWEAKGRLLNVYFSDLRPFHSIPLNAAHPSTVHLCDPDRYEVAYDFSAWPQWETRWCVEGPRKDYVMHSIYTRP